jgi:RNA-directed DNA polymerase
MDLTTLFNPATLQAAYQWVCRRRSHYPPNADIWDLRFHCEAIKHPLLAQLCQGRYRFSPLQPIRKADGELIHLWTAQDALVMKMLAMGIAPELGISPYCTHVRGHGGLKQTVERLHTRLPDYGFVMRTDVAGNYAHIDQRILLEQLARRLPDRRVLNLLWQVLRRTVSVGGLYRDIERGIARGSPLSPLLGALYLEALDERLGGLEPAAGIVYARYMDDILILAKTRWRLRRVARVLKQHLAALSLQPHPDKTWIGPTERGFEFLGYRLSFHGLGVARANPGAIRHTLSSALRARAGHRDQQRPA